MKYNNAVCCIKERKPSVSGLWCRLHYSLKLEQYLQLSSHSFWWNCPISRLSVFSLFSHKNDGIRTTWRPPAICFFMTPVCLSPLTCCRKRYEAGHILPWCCTGTQALQTFLLLSRFYWIDSFMTCWAKRDEFMTLMNPPYVNINVSISTYYYPSINSINLEKVQLLTQKTKY